MPFPSERIVSALRDQFSTGSRVELTHMDDPYAGKLHEGCLGTVTSVDDAGTILVAWDCGSSLGVVYGEDSCSRID